MINLDPVNYKYGTSVTENGETRAVIEVHDLSIWEGLRMLVSMERELFFDHLYDRHVRWLVRCTLAEAKYKLIREAQDAYDAAFRESIGL